LYADCAKTDTEKIIQRLNEIENTKKLAPLQTPAEVSTEITEITKSLGIPVKANIDSGGKANGIPE
jgi:hypothetical protein